MSLGRLLLQPDLVSRHVMQTQWSINGCTIWYGKQHHDVYGCHQYFDFFGTNLRPGPRQFILFKGLYDLRDSLSGLKKGLCPCSPFHSLEKRIGISFSFLFRLNLDSTPNNWLQTTMIMMEMSLESRTSYNFTFKPKMQGYFDRFLCYM